MVDILTRLRYRAARGRLHMPLTWLRHRGLDPRDVFLASYPRSGQHWTRFQLFELLTGQSAEFDTLDLTIPKVGEHRSAPGLLPSGGRLIQTHEPWRKEYKRAILLVRDCRDVVLSDYAWDESLHLTRHFDVSSLDEYLLPWLEGTVQTMGNWQDYTLSWLECPIMKEGNVLMIRFEDMRRNTVDALAHMAEFLGLSADRSTIANVIANNSVDRMRAKEDTSEKYNRERLGRRTSEEHRFVRKGAVGGWRDRLTQSQIRLIDRYAGTALQRLGYPLGDAVLADTLSRPATITAK